MDLKTIEFLAEQDRLEEALAGCAELLAGTTVDKAEALRARAFVYALMNDYENAIRDRKAAIDIGNDTLDDHHTVALYALSLGDLDESVIYLNETVRLGKEIGETWYESNSYFLLAFAQMELKQFEIALVNLENANRLEPDCPYHIPHVGMCTYDQLREEIGRRMKGNFP